MRPVNLIPPEDRRGDHAPLRSGPLSYILVGVLAFALLGVTLLVTTSNGVTDKKSRVAQLEVDLEAATAEAGELAAYTEFAALRTSREATIASLAQSRFDWERVMRELALVIPENVTLTELGGSAVGNAEGSTAGTEIGAPNLSLKGCAASHVAVAKLVVALEDIDGVTRVGLARTEAVEQATGSAAVDGDPLCGAANTFDLSVAFDSAPVSPAVVDAAAVPAGAPASATTTADPDAQAQTAQVDSQEQQTQKAKKAANVVPGVVAP